MSQKIDKTSVHYRSGVEAGRCLRRLADLGYNTSGLESQSLSGHAKKEHEEGVKDGMYAGAPSLDVEARTVTFDGDTIAWGRIDDSFKILQLLAKKHCETVKPREIMASCAARSEPKDKIRNLRKKLHRLGLRELANSIHSMNGGYVLF